MDKIIMNAVNASFPAQPVWRITGTSVRGMHHAPPAPAARHALGWLTPPGTDLALLAASVGHPQAENFRSDDGARLAIDTALRILPDFLQSMPAQDDLAALQEAATTTLPALLGQHWQEAVANTLAQAPLSLSELQILEQRYGSMVRQEVETRPQLAYNTTLLAVLVTHRYLICLQLGEGALLAVSETGQAMRLLPAIDPGVGGASPSLATPDTWHRMQASVQLLDTPPPALILLLASSSEARSRQQDEAALLQEGSSLLWRLRINGSGRVQPGLEAQLTAMHQAGLGDDLTLGLLYRLEAVFLPDMAGAGEPSTSQSERGDAGEAQAGTPLSPPPLEPVALEAAPPQPVSLPSRLLRAVTVEVQCRRTKRLFTLHITERGHGRWIADGVLMTPHLIPWRSENGHATTITGDLGFESTYPGCPHCQAMYVFQCGCGQMACWDGARRVLSCPWCSALSEGDGHIEELRAHEAG
jgi:hypothetical protein